MPTVTHNRLQPRRVPCWARAALLAQAVLSLPATFARLTYGRLCEAVRSEGMVSIDGEAKLCRASIRRYEP